jgi:hypothetical protein
VVHSVSVARSRGYGRRPLILIVSAAPSASTMTEVAVPYERNSSRHTPHGLVTWGSPWPSMLTATTEWIGACIVLIVYTAPLMLSFFSGRLRWRRGWSGA